MKRMIRDCLESKFGTEDPGLLQNFYEEYRSNMTDGIAMLKRQLKSGSADLLVKKAHTLKGLALIIGDKDLSDLLLKFECAALEENFEACRKLLPGVDNGLTMLQDNSENE